MDNVQIHFGFAKFVTVAIAIALKNVVKLVKKSADVLPGEKMRHHPMRVKTIGADRKTSILHRFLRLSCRIRVSAAKKIH